MLLLFNELNLMYLHMNLKDTNKQKCKDVKLASGLHLKVAFMFYSFCLMLLTLI